MSILDYLIVFAFLAFTVSAGFLFRKANTDSRSYFLGSKNNFVLLAASGSSSNYSLMGTIWLISMILVLGIKFHWLMLFLWLPLPAFLIAFTAIWIRRCGVITSAEIIAVRFGDDNGARLGRTAFAIMVTVFNVATICMSYIAIYQFAGGFGFPQHITATAVISITGVYVLFGGFTGVIWMDFIQAILMSMLSLVIAVVALDVYSVEELRAGIAALSGSVDNWKSINFVWEADLGLFNESGYSEWQTFGSSVVVMSLIGLIGCIGGAGGTYGEQRFLAANSVRDSAKTAALWQIFLVPRIIFVSALVFLAFTMFRDTMTDSLDPDQIIPLFLQSGLLGAGVLGLFIASLIAAFMSTFSSILNAGASIIVRDLYLPFTKNRDDTKKILRVSYLATLMMIAGCLIGGYCFVEFGQDGAALNSLWVWIMSGVITCYVVPLALRWYWARMNGWGFACGILAGLPFSLCILVQSFVAQDHFINSFPVSMFVAGILVASFLGVIFGSLLTSPVDDGVLLNFYARVRPFGFWKDVELRALGKGMKLVPKIGLSRAIFNTLVAAVAVMAMYLAPLYYLGYWSVEFYWTIGVLAICFVLLYFTWFRWLPDD